MRPILESGDRRILIAAAALLVGLSAASILVAPPPDRTRGFPSTYSSGERGLRVAYLLLQDLGFEPYRWQRPLTELPTPGAGVALILADPPEFITDNELKALREFVATGGRLIGGSLALRDWIPGELETRPAGSPAREETFDAILPSPLAGAPRISMGGGRRALHAVRGSAGAVGVYGDHRGFVVATAEVGQGKVIWLASSTPFSNAGLAGPGGLALLMGSLAGGDITQVLFDEYHHGHKGSLWSYMQGTPVPWGLLQAGVVLLAVCATHSRRLGPPRTPVEEPRHSPLEFVETVGDLYARAGATAGAVEIPYRRLRAALGRRVGLPASAATEQIVRAARERLGDPGGSLASTFRDCERAARGESPGAWQALQLMQALHGHARALGTQGACPEERR
ncbi:MAG TPA: DUF4350 domain-containing protein [Candidatus Polarisedimenticolia bacterium]|nr:DUF4350 domain-containing protein [Candidatus Polarisedimenticolia bacterium]